MVVLQSNKRSVNYGQKTIDYSLLYSKRKTLEIAVHPDSTVIVKAPIDSDILLIENKLQKRARWIFRQLKYFQQFEPKTPDRCYITGETHLYLGRQYRLKIVKGKETGVRLIKGFFHVSCKAEENPETVKRLMYNWYLQKANIKFNESLTRCWPKFCVLDLTKPSIAIKQMKMRWGSLSNEKIITLNTNLIKAPKECIDYVITHELCHLKHNNHSPEFYQLLDSAIPGWEKIKHKLELHMS